MKEEKTVAGCVRARIKSTEIEPMPPHERVEYWLAKVAKVFGVTETSYNCDLVKKRYEAAIVVKGRRLVVSVVIGRPQHDMSVSLRLLAWKLQELCHVN